MKYRSLLLLLVLIVLIVVPPVSADVTMIFRDRSLFPTASPSFHILEVNGTGTYDLGLYNTSSDSYTRRTEKNESVVFIMQYVPSNSDFVASPMTGINQFVDWVLGRYADLLAVFFIIALICIAIALAWSKRRG
jgi:hypothetical protein